MKYTITTLLGLLFLTVNVHTATAVTTTPSPSPSVSPTTQPTETEASRSGILDRIERIKEMVASRVAELKLVEKKGFYGTVIESSTSQITVQDKNREEREIDIDELTKFEDASNKSFGISDISKGDAITAVGLYNKDTKRLLARVITPVKNLPIQFEGIVKAVDTRNFQITVTNEKGETKTVDIERSTITESYEKESGTVKSGYTKIKVGERTLITGYDSTTEKNLIAASRIIHFVDVPPSSAMKANQAGNSTTPAN
jgi:hypothetical protein